MRSISDYAQDRNEPITDLGTAKKAAEQLASRLQNARDGDEELVASARALPLLLADRRAAADATLRLAAADRQFRRQVAEADKARDSRAWSEGEYNYWLALRMYPLHRGYIVQYAHCLREQNKFIDAEIEYRNAFALGETTEEMRNYITISSAGRGGQLFTTTLNAISVYWSNPDVRSRPMDLPPIRQDVLDLCDLLLGRKAEQFEIVDIMNLSPSILDVALHLFRSQEFQAANKRLLTLITELGEAIHA